jgi:hypothetical protein
VPTNSKNKKWFGLAVVCAPCFVEPSLRAKRSNLILLVAFILCCLLLACSARAGTAWKQKQKLLASDGAAWDWFGCSVSISGDYAIVGASGNDDRGTDSGSAYIFKWDGTGWVQQQKLTASDGAAYDDFGVSVSISGDYAIIGADGDDDWGNKSGSAYIFKWDGTNWSQQQKLIASDGAAYNYFGCSVSISGDYAVVGAIGDDYRGDWSGSAYIFKRNEISWLQQAKLLAEDGDKNNCFGCSVSISGDYAIIGAFGGNGNATYSGSAYIFAPNNVDPNNWVQQQKLTASDGAAYDDFGVSVSISGDKAIVGAHYDDDYSGSAYIFKWDGKIWNQQVKLFASDGAAYDYFGWSVSVSGDYAIVGAYYDDDNGTDSGSAYIFRWDGSGWVQQQKLLASDGAVYDNFGVSVSISGDKTIVGAYSDDDRGTNSGSVYIFVLTVTVLTPNGGENLVAGSTYDITWDTNGIFENVFIEYSGDNGANWTEIDTVPNTGLYEWLVPQINSNQCLVRISDTGYPVAGDVSDDVFRIYVCANWLTADLYGDCIVNFKDFSILSNQWLQAPGYPSSDLVPEGGDGVVNFLDLSIIVDQWLRCGDPCDPNCQQ